ncbi:hypothetical protein DFJ73DRAFT_565207 [Zopfochytrium polystomum]|nr:hypothetical protein DFJ73DRAFT_565207 [Zopfochytrium polystomum]
MPKPTALRPVDPQGPLRTEFYPDAGEGSDASGIFLRKKNQGALSFAQQAQHPPLPSAQPQSPLLQMRAHAHSVLGLNSAESPSADVVTDRSSSESSVGSSSFDEFIDDPLRPSPEDVALGPIRSESFEFTLPRATGGETPDLENGPDPSASVGGSIPFSTTPASYPGFIVSTAGPASQTQSHYSPSVVSRTDTLPHPPSGPSIGAKPQPQSSLSHLIEPRTSSSNSSQLLSAVSIPTDSAVLLPDYSDAESNSRSSMVSATEINDLSQGAASSGPPPAPVSSETVLIKLNGVEFEVSKNSSISLGLLGVNRSHFLYVNGEFVKLNRDGTPRSKIDVTSQMTVETFSYPNLWPLDFVYWASMNHAPTRKELSKMLDQPWGIVTYNCVLMLLTAALARPVINRSANTAQIVVSVISGARIVDLFLKDTVYKLLSQSRLTTSHFLVVLFVAQLSAMTAGSISISCFRLLEFRAVPFLLIGYVLLVPLTHKMWTLLGAWVGARTSRGSGRWGVVEYSAVLFGVSGPFFVVCVWLYAETTNRLSLGSVDLFVC